MDLHGENIRYCHPWGKWLVFDGTRWCIDDQGRPMTLAIDTVRSMYDDLSSFADRTDRNRHYKHAEASESCSRLSAMLNVAKSMVPVGHEEFDKDPWLFNCPNGTLDLRTGELREHRRDDFITQMCPTPYVADATAPVFERAISAILGGDNSVISFMQRVFGYALTGITTEHILPILYGSGSNGKSTLTEAILATLGSDYSMKAPADLLIAKRQSDHPTKYADLFGKRFVACVETQDGDRFDECLVKELTGGDRIRARRMREDFWEFSPTHKVVLSTNHRPEVQGTDHAIWRRLALVPFTVKFWEPDRGETGPDELRVNKQLGQQLRAEAEGILAWMVRGCLDWQRDGLQVPESVRGATAEYRTEEDVVDRFIQDRCRTGGHTMVGERASNLYEAYRRWCGEEGEVALNNTRFGRILTEKGYPSRRSGGIWRLGIATRPL